MIAVVIIRDSEKHVLSSEGSSSLDWPCDIILDSYLKFHKHIFFAVSNIIIYSLLLYILLQNPIHGYLTYLLANARCAAYSVMKAT